MPLSRLKSLKVRAKLLQKAKQKQNPRFTLKEALQIVAQSKGYASWRELKDELETAELFVAPQASAYWHTWYANYDEAKQHQSQSGGYLLKYQRDYFVCDANYLHALGMDASDADVVAIGNDWTQPRNAEAWERLLVKLKARRRT